MIPTNRCFGLLIFGGCLAWVLAQETLGFGGVQGLWFPLLGFDGGVLLLMVVDGWRIGPRVQVQRQPLPRLSLGRIHPIEITVTMGDRPTRIQVIDTPPEGDRGEIPQGGGLGIQPFEVHGAAHHRQTLTYPWRPSRRGPVQWGDLEVRQRGPWGLAWRQWRVPQGMAAMVYPDLVGLRELTLKLTLPPTGRLRQIRVQGLGTEFAELREYHTGDDPRMIDWKATARRGHPLVRVLEPEREQTLLILLDRGRLMTAQVQGLSRFDWGLKATLALALAALHRGDRVGICLFDRHIHTWIPPERGYHRLPKIIEQLAPVQPVFLEPDYVGTVSTLVNRQSRRALVVLITEIIEAMASAELLAALGRLTPRYLPFCVTLRDPELDRQAQTVVQDVEGAYGRAVALDLLAQRQAAFGNLRQRGVLVLDAPAHQVDGQIVERYLQIKARHQL